MRDLAWLAVGLIIGLGETRVVAQQAADAVSRNEANPSAAGRHYKVVYWFDGQGWKSQPYDVDRGEFTKAVDDWVAKTEFDAFGFARPGKFAMVRDIRVEDAPAETRKVRLAAAIAAEFDQFRRKASAARPSTSSSIASGRAETARRPAASGSSRLPSGPRTSPGASGIDPSTIPQGSPFPYPYSRPHP